jgi:hypothetical protein
MEGRPLIVEAGGEALRAGVQWTPVERAAVPTTAWVPYLSEHLDALLQTQQTQTKQQQQQQQQHAAAARTLSVQRWVEQGRDEHASVASFNRFSLSLMARGAPASLVRRAQLAALDEIKHAELSFSLAAALNATASSASSSVMMGGGDAEEVWVPGVGPIVLPNPLPLDGSDEEMLRAAFREGCIGEVGCVRCVLCCACVVVVVVAAAASRGFVRKTRPPATAEEPVSRCESLRSVCFHFLLVCCYCCFCDCVIVSVIVFFL